MKKVFFSLFISIMLVLLMSSIAFAADADNDYVGTDVGLTGVFLAIITLAVLIESLAELVKAAISPATLPKWVWFIITSVFGAVLCIMFKVDMFVALGFVGGATAVILGQIITGITVGAGSGFVHTLLGKLTASKNADKIISQQEPFSLEGLTESNKKSDETTG